MLTVRFENSSQRAWINSVPARVRSETPGMLEECGQVLVEQARAYFTRLSRGGNGYSGRAWAPPTTKTMQQRRRLAARGQLAAPADVQGIVSGEMAGSLGYQVGGNKVKVSYDDPKAYWFNIHRRLIPSRLPNEWRDACQRVVSRHLVSLNQERF